MPRTLFRLIPRVMRACALVALFLSASLAQAQQDQFLAPFQAFKYAIASDGQSVTVHWDVTPGYYLYKSRMDVVANAPGVSLGRPEFPPGEMHSDEYFGEQEIFRGQFDVRVPLSVADMALAPRELPVTLKLQGCADAGLCYPPQTWDAKVQLPNLAITASALDQALKQSAVAAGGDEFLPPDEAFRLTAIADGPDRVKLMWQIAPDYYLYRTRVSVQSASGEAQLGKPDMPSGEMHTDEYFGAQEIYHDELIATVPAARAAATSMRLPIDVTYQGCADAGLCYPPITKTLNIDLPAGSSSAKPFVSKQDQLAALVRSGNVLVMLGSFFVAGLLLAFTPCVLPMVPILSGIIVGQGNITTRRAFLLSLSYVMGMALTYTLAGIAAAAAGAQIQAIFQQTWILVLFALLFVVLALSMFGFFTIQMPAAIQSRLADASNQQRAGTLGGVAVMGALSALIVTTCVGPALVAALAVIGQSGEMVRGGAALFAMSLGMGAPLLAVGASGGKLLPKAGPWMDTVKQLFGVMFLLVAAWMLARIVPARFSLLLWAIPAIAAAWVMLRAVGHARGKLGLRLAGGITGAYGLLLLAGAALGGTDPLSPLPSRSASHSELPFRTIKSVADLEREVDAARVAGKPVMLDFYADWCVSCKEMEKYTFTDAAVQTALQPAILLRADVTANDDKDQALLKHFGIFGPPTIAFYGPDGAERGNFRVVGYMKAAEFAALSAQAMATGG